MPRELYDGKLHSIIALTSLRILNSCIKVANNCYEELNAKLQEILAKKSNLV